MRSKFGRRLLLATVLVAAVTLPFIAISAPPDRPALDKMLGQVRTEISQVSVGDAHALMAGGGTLFVDVRSDAEWAAGHLPGAKHLDRGKLEFSVERAVPDRSTPIVVYCKSGDRGALATRTLMEMGYTNVRNLTGGFEGWKKAGYNVTM